MAYFYVIAAQGGVYGTVSVSVLSHGFIGCESFLPKLFYRANDETGQQATRQFSLIHLMPAVK